MDIKADQLVYKDDASFNAQNGWTKAVSGSIAHELDLESVTLGVSYLPTQSMVVFLARA